MKLQEGGVFSRGGLRTSVRAIVDRYSELGRARAEVDPRTVNDVANLKVDVTIAIVEGGDDRKVAGDLTPGEGAGKITVLGADGDGA